jgi:hypothetical protein
MYRIARIHDYFHDYVDDVGVWRYMQMTRAACNLPEAPNPYSTYCGSSLAAINGHLHSGTRNEYKDSTDAQYFNDAAGRIWSQGLANNDALGHR